MACFGGCFGRNRHVSVTLAGIAVNVIGLLVLAPITPDQINTAGIFQPRLFFGILLVGIGYISFLQTTKVWAKQLYPEDSRGQFEGVWIVFFVLIPMIGGSLLGQQAVKGTGETFLDTVSGQLQYIPNGNIFRIGAVAIALSAIPVLLAVRHFRARVSRQQ